MSGQPPFKNTYHRRQVADAASKACFICCKPTSVVLVSSDGKADFFYVCQGHLLDAGFATPVIDDDVTTAKAKLVTLDNEINQMKSSIETRKNAAKGYFNFGFKKKTDDKEKEKSRDEIVLEKDESLLEKLVEAREKSVLVAERPPRTFTLAKQFYAMRINSRRNQQASKQTQQKLTQPDLFPKIPNHTPGLNKP